MGKKDTPVGQAWRRGCWLVISALTAQLSMCTARARPAPRGHSGRRAMELTSAHTEAHPGKVRGQTL